MNSSSGSDKLEEKVTGIFSRRSDRPQREQRTDFISPELSGMQMIYRCSEQERYYALPVLCWGLMSNGAVEGLVPWQDEVRICRDVKLAYGGKFVGYQTSGSNSISEQAPLPKIAELQAMSEEAEATDGQMIPEIIGTHALVLTDNEGGFDLKPVVAWSLVDGQLEGMFLKNYEQRHKPLSEQAKLTATQAGKTFAYYFHYAIAKRIKAREPKALASIRSIVAKITATRLN